MNKPTKELLSKLVEISEDWGVELTPETWDSLDIIPSSLKPYSTGTMKLEEVFQSYYKDNWETEMESFIESLIN